MKTFLFFSPTIDLFDEILYNLCMIQRTFLDKDWYKNNCIYQIYPQSFLDSDGDGIGDIKGIISKLDYIKSLNVGAIWLCPMYDSPNRDNGYDVRNYFALQPQFGTLDDFALLTEKCHALGIRVIMDMVLNHSSNECEWFIESASSESNPKRDWYMWKKGKSNGEPPTNWEAIFGGSAWTYDEKTDSYYLGTFSPYQPDFNWENEELRNQLFDILRFWLDKGVDGFRLDAINFISKNSSYPDGIAGANGLAPIRPFVCNGSKVHDWLGEMKGKVLKPHHAMTVGEADGSSVEDAIRFAKEMDMVFSFDHVALDVGENFTFNRNIPLKKLKSILGEWQTKLREKAWNALFWENHDQPRIVSRMGDEGKFLTVSAKMLTAALLFLQGTPFIYQGEELGLPNTHFDSRTELRDFEIMNAFSDYVDKGLLNEEQLLDFANYKGRDTGRTPIPWNDSNNAGFTQGTPWIKLSATYEYINVAGQETDPNSVLNWYRRLIAFRKNNVIIRDGEYKVYNEDDPCVYEYTRMLHGKGYHILCSFCENDTLYRTGFEGETTKILFSNYDDDNFFKTGKLRPFETVISEAKLS